MDGRGPKSIGIIPDGNRRWAAKNLFTLTKSYKQGSKKIWDIIEWSLEYPSIKNIFVFLFSKENLRRKGIQKAIVKRVIEREANLALESDFFKKNSARVVFLGDKEVLGKDLSEKLSVLEERTKENSRLTIFVCIGYGSKTEIVHAAKCFAKDVKLGKIGLSEINKNNFSRYFYCNSPKVDLLIRTGGEKRLSNFMLYQCAYAVLFFTEKYLSEFTKDDFISAIRAYIKSKNSKPDF